MLKYLEAMKYIKLLTKNYCFMVCTSCLLEFKIPPKSGVCMYQLLATKIRDDLGVFGKTFECGNINTFKNIEIFIL